MNAGAGAVGVVFGAMLFATGMADYDVIHEGLLFRHAHLYLMMAATMVTGVPLLWLLRRRAPRSLFAGTIRVSRDAFERKHITGGLLFGTGWALAGTCPGAVAAMAASGKPWALLVMVGVATGVTLRDLQEETRPLPVAAAAAPAGGASAG